jgi:hypothetical protein
VEPVPRARDHDPELDPPRRPSLHLRDPLPEEYQRLVANPFLAVLGLIAWSQALRYAYNVRDPLLLLGVALSLPGVVFLLQYHCLDCGRTGLLIRWRRHACERVVARRIADRPRRVRGPNPSIQVVLWGYLLLGLAVLAGILYRATL